MSTSLNQQHPGTLPRNTGQNLKNNGHYIFITTKSHKITIDPPKTAINESKNDSVDVDEILQVDMETSIGSVEMDKEKGKVVEPVLKAIP